MTRDDAFATYQSLAAEVLAVDAAKVTADASFADDLDADSLDLVEFVMALEEKFDVSIPEEELAGVSTVGGAFELLCGKLSI
jgi:acyl carrier protein